MSKVPSYEDGRSLTREAVHTEVRASQDQVALVLSNGKHMLRCFVHELQAAGSKRAPNGVGIRPFTTFCHRTSGKQTTILTCICIRLTMHQEEDLGDGYS